MNYLSLPYRDFNKLWNNGEHYADIRVTEEMDGRVQIIEGRRSIEGIITDIEGLVITVEITGRTYL